MCIRDRDKGAIYSYETNYSGYLERKAEREESAEASERKRQSVLRKELEWVRRGAKARTTKQKGRLQRYEELKNQKAPERDSQVEMSSVYSRMGKTTIELDHITKGYDGRTLLRDFSYIFLKGDRIGFIGANGSGKTTLMKMIAGRIKPDAGTITVGATIKIGYYTQEIETGREAGIAYMDPEEKVIDYIRNTAEYVRTTDGLVSASNMLERFLFSAAQQYSPIGKLSGGERRRLNLLRVLMEAPNVLILDEPTNDLDTQTLAILEDYLDSYEGIVIVVSHDRYFLDRVVRRIFAFEGNGEIRQYEGGYTDYVNRLAEEGRKPGEPVEFQEAAGRNASAAEGAQETGGVTGTSGQNAAEPVSYTHLESIQDPGNLGTMLRTGEGAGITGIIMNRTTVDLFNPKTIRSTMGSIYRVPYYIADDLAETIGELKRQKVGIYAAHLKGQMHYDEPSYCKGTAFLIGNEGNGLSDEIAGLADNYVRIPMEGSVESLNAAVSAALLMYETNRQRRRNGK